jgi:hypothetical protein
VCSRCVDTCRAPRKQLWNDNEWRKSGGFSRFFGSFTPPRVDWIAEHALKLTCSGTADGAFVQLDFVDRWQMCSILGAGDSRSKVLAESALSAASVVPIFTLAAHISRNSAPPPPTTGLVRVPSLRGCLRAA